NGSSPIYGWAFRLPAHATSAGTANRLMPRILLAEDDDSLRGFLARALERAGYDVTACADGEEAAAVLGEPWDLLLTDIVMPGMDGIEVARLAAQRQPGLRIM